MRVWNKDKHFLHILPPFLPPFLLPLLTPSLPPSLISSLPLEELTGAVGRTSEAHQLATEESKLRRKRARYVTKAREKTPCGVRLRPGPLRPPPSSFFFAIFEGSFQTKARELALSAALCRFRAAVKIPHTPKLPPTAPRTAFSRVSPVPVKPLRDLMCPVLPPPFVFLSLSFRGKGVAARGRGAR